MKHTWKLFLLGLFSITLLTGCNSDDDTLDNEASIVGVWNVVAYDYGGSVSTTFQGQTTSSEFTGEFFNIDLTLDITENPNEMNSAGSYDIRLTSTLDGSPPVEQTVSFNDISGQGTWTRNGNVVTITGEFVNTSTPTGTDFTSQDWTITELTANSLTMTTTVDFNSNQAGFSSTGSLDATMVLNR